MSAEVLGCFQGLSELKFFLRVPNNIYFDLKKVLGEAIALYTSPKSGEITFNLRRFWDTCWLIILIYDFIETNLHFPITLKIWHYFLRSGNLNFNTKQEWDHKTKRYKITINYTNCEVWLQLNNLKSKSRIILQHSIFAQKSISIHFTVGVQVGNL